MRKRWIVGGAVIVIVAALGAVLAVAAHGAGGNSPMAGGAINGAAAKQLWHCGMHPQVVRDHPGDCPICHMALTPIGDNKPTGESDQRKVLYWWDPMLGPSSKSDHPGLSAMGMEMVPVYADSAGPQVRIDPAVVQNMGVRTAHATRGNLTRTVRTVGILSLPEPGLHDVSLKVGGWIDTLYANQEGMHVARGQPLFELYSPDLQVAEQELIAAVKSSAALGAGASPSLRQESQKMIDSARRKLRLWDVDERDIETIARADQPPRDITFRSPASGHIEEKMIVAGSSVQPGMKLLRVADHSTMWLDAQVYAGQLPFVKIGDKVKATVEGIPGKTFAGTITFMHPHLDPTSRTLKVRATLDNPRFELKPGMYATADIITQPVAGVVICPREAVIDTGTRQIVFVTEADGHFSPRNVRMGLIGDNDQAQIVDGLAPGEQVVTSGQFLLDVESRTIEATQKLSEAPTAAPAEAAVPEAAPMVMPATTPATMPAMHMDSKPMMPDMPMPAPARPATSQAAAPPTPLTQVYCPMAKAAWLQAGDSVANPYLGQKMPNCGEVRAKVNAPPANSALAPFVKAYLDTQRALSADKLDPSALAALNSAAERLSADAYAGLKDSAAKLKTATDLKSARAAFKTVSAELRKSLQNPAH